MPFLFTLTCLLGATALVTAEWRRDAISIVLAKTGASLSFIAVALALGATGSGFGQLMLLALVLGAVGDVCLLSRRDVAFLAGLGFFLLSHLAYAVAFAKPPLHLGALVTGAMGMLGVGVATLRWLWPYLRGAFRPAVVAYVTAIGLMCALALSFSVALGDWRPAVGALLFAASDLSVARQAFVRPAFLNKAWGLPAYYVAQLLMAWSVVPLA